MEAALLMEPVINPPLEQQLDEPPPLLPAPIPAPAPAAPAPPPDAAPAPAVPEEQPQEENPPAEDAPPLDGDEEANPPAQRSFVPMSEYCDTHPIIEAWKEELESPKIADQVLLIGPEEKEFRVVRSVLAMGSPFFHRMFFSSFVESGSSEAIKCPNIHPIGFEVFLRYAYLQDPQVSDDNVFDALEAAHYFQADRLERMCVKFLEDVSNISPEVFFDSCRQAVMPQEAARISRDKMRDFCQKVFNEEFLQAPIFLEIDEEILAMLLSSETCYLSEELLWKRVVEWAKKRTEPPETMLEEKQEFPPTEDWKDVMKRLLVHFRFGAMTGKFFVREVQCLGLLDPEHLLPFLTYFVDPSPENRDLLPWGQDLRSPNIELRDIRTSILGSTNATITWSLPKAFKIDKSEIHFKVTVHGTTEPVECMARVDGDAFSADVQVLEEDHDYEVTIESHFKKRNGACVSRFQFHTLQNVRYTLSLSTQFNGPTNTYESLIDTTTTQNGAGTENRENQWIRASFEADTHVRNIVLGAANSAMPGGWGATYLNNSICQRLVNPDGDDWEDLFTITDLQEDEIRSFPVDVTTRSIRLFRARRNYLGLSVMKFDA